MNYKILLGWKAILLVAFISGASTNDYTELETIGFSCPLKDDCRQRTRDHDFNNTNCECDRNCALYGDCCINADVVRRPRFQSPYVCIAVNQTEESRERAVNATASVGVQALSKCPSGWSGSIEIKNRCQNSNNMSDPVIAAPATNPSGSITYRNGYCAICNNQNLIDLTSWNPRVKCPSVNGTTDDYNYEDLFYNSALNVWGIQAGDRFHSCSIMYEMPNELKNVVRYCRPAVQTCLRRSRPAIKQKCEKYTAVVYAGKITYKNPHCAMCNGVELSSLSCNKNAYLLSRRKQPMSFALLLDVNKSDGPIVGTRQVDCGAGKKYDPFFKKCRTLVCAVPGYTMVNDRCVRET